MIPIEQTILTPPDGNCFAACVASILEVPLAEVPSVPEPAWWPALEAWLAPRGLAVLHFAVRPEDIYRPPGYAILHADAPRDPEVKHAVVVRDGEIVWNPHPMRHLGVGAHRGFTVFVALDPSTRAPNPDPRVHADP